jgi:hypothetical protein
VRVSWPTRICGRRAAAEREGAEHVDAAEPFLQVPRDWAGTFEPLLVPKRAGRVAGGLDDMVISLYAHGMSVRDILHHLEQVYGTQLSHETVSRITDGVLERSGPGSPGRWPPPPGRAPGSGATSWPTCATGASRDILIACWGYRLEVDDPAENRLICQLAWSDRAHDSGTVTRSRLRPSQGSWRIRPA